jgi:hypothetical protein
LIKERRILKFRNPKFCSATYSLQETYGKHIDPRTKVTIARQKNFQILFGNGGQYKMADQEPVLKIVSLSLNV